METYRPIIGWKSFDPTIGILPTAEHVRPTIGDIAATRRRSPERESFQSRQSEFLAIGSMIVLTIFLRQRGSPESKPVDAPHGQTGTD
nr:hypothetical protein [uncultured bacterium]